MAVGRVGLNGLTVASHVGVFVSETVITRLLSSMDQIVLESLMNLLDVETFPVMVSIYMSTHQCIYNLLSRIKTIICPSL